MRPDQHEVLERLVGELLQRGHDGDRPARRGEATYNVRGLVAATAVPSEPPAPGRFVDDEGLAQRFLQFLREHARGDVGRLAGRPMAPRPFTGRAG